MKRELWVIIVLVVGFLGFMMGYSVPPFLEVGFGDAEQAAQEAGGAPSEEALMQEYEKLYQDDSSEP